ncbi:DUF2142 domain-containing protein [Thermoleophilum album]|jgi:MFS family permease|uniref:DUF2142 domain-containing protein n=1 Tax=Thermoleophilum album TaxID=29539 RepID=UPI00237CE9D2|nr:DUF2142 domain-containing protein [Thermoleophilum album]WDT93495.1 DUF2142 domain-containing protein [Thermoleophilum album]
MSARLSGERRRRWLASIDRLLLAVGVLVAFAVPLLRPTQLPLFVTPAQPVEQVAVVGKGSAPVCFATTPFAGEVRLRLWLRREGVGSPRTEVGRGVRIAISARARDGALVGTRLARIELTSVARRVDLPLTAPPGTTAVCIAGGGRARAALLGQGGTPTSEVRRASARPLLADLGALVDRIANGSLHPVAEVLGSWVVVLPFAAFALAIAWVVRLLGRGRQLALRTVAGSCAALGFAHALVWAALVPPFQVPDEQVHYHYAAYLAQHGLGPPPTGRFADRGSPQQSATMEVLGTGSVAFNPRGKPPWQSIDDALERAERLPNRMAAVRTNASSQPPLFYATLAPAALLFDDVLPQLLAMRLVGAAWMGALAALAALFFAALAPRALRAALIVGTATALFPLAAFIGGGVNPDVALAATTMLALLAGLRFLECPTVGRGVTFAAAAAAPPLVKLTGLALVPGFVAIVAVFAAQRGRSLSGRQRSAVAASLAITALLAFCAYAAWADASGRPLLPAAVSSSVGAAGGTATTPPVKLREFASYAWQFYLPRLPFQQDLIPGQPWRSVWLDGLAGRFGYLDYSLPGGVAVVLAVFLLGLVIAALRGATAVVRSRGWALLRDPVAGVVVAAALCALGVLFTVAWSDYNSLRTGGVPFRQARYLLPLLPLVVLAAVAARRGLAARYRGIAATVVLFACGLWSGVAIVTTVGRYYL